MKLITLATFPPKDKLVQLNEQPLVCSRIMKIVAGRRNLSGYKNAAKLWQEKWALIKSRLLFWTRYFLVRARWLFLLLRSREKSAWFWKMSFEKVILPFYVSLHIHIFCFSNLTLSVAEIIVVIVSLLSMLWQYFI